MYGMSGSQKRFNRAGCHVIIGDISAERGQEVVKQYATSKVKVEFVDMSVLDDETIQRLIGHAVNSHGRIDFAVNTAGVTGPTGELYRAVQTAVACPVGAHVSHHNLY